MKIDRRVRSNLVLTGAALLLSSCGTPTDGGVDGNGDHACDLPLQYFTDVGLGRGAIPTLQNPELISASPLPGNEYLLDTDRVFGFILAGEPIAVPHNILWYHEVVNLDRGSEHIAITYCPITGSGLGFDRNSIGGQELGVSGLLFMNNLIMFNRGEPESLWPQMMGEARCKAEVGRRLDRFPIFEMTWQAWTDLYPQTSVITSDVNISRDYTLNPYGDYGELTNNDFLFPAMPDLDERRPAKERVIGLPSTDAGEPGIAFPFLALDAETGGWVVEETTWAGEDVVLLWADVPTGGGVFRPFHPVTGERLEFVPTSQDGIQDTTTGSRWSITGEAIDGPLLGEQLEPVVEGYVAYWGAWAAFHPNTRLWLGS